MTEKRFTFADGFKIVAIKDNDKIMNSKQVCNKLNELYEENEQLRKEKIDAEVKLYSANEQILMQMDYDEIIKQNTENEMEIINLKKENEQLKSFKNRVFGLLADEIKEENELLDYYIKEKAPCNADRQQIIIGVLKRLQKELKE